MTKVLLERFFEGKLRAGFVARQPWPSCSAGQLGPNNLVDLHLPIFLLCAMPCPACRPDDCCRCPGRRTVHIYNWSDYIGRDDPGWLQATGIQTGFTTCSTPMKPGRQTAGRAHRLRRGRAIEPLHSASRSRRARSRSSTARGYQVFESTRRCSSVWSERSGQRAVPYL